MHEGNDEFRVDFNVSGTSASLLFEFPFSRRFLFAGVSLVLLTRSLYVTTPYINSFLYVDSLHTQHADLLLHCSSSNR